MTYKGHILLASSMLLGSAVLINFLHMKIPFYNTPFSLNNIDTVIINTFFFFLGSLLPDIDEPNSYIGRKLPFISTFFGHIFTHRGFTHTLLFSLIPIALFNFTGLSLFVFLSMGILSHCVGDMLTKGGIIGFFYPFFKNKRIGIPKVLAFYTGGLVESIFNTFLLFLNLYLIWYLYFSIGVFI
jgi:inner membrane protein